MSGTEVAAAVLHRHENLPILFVTGTPLDLWDRLDRQNLRMLRSTNRVAILEKPFAASAFQSAVAGMLQEEAAARV
jgi:hypothetical protein